MSALPVTLLRGIKDFPTGTRANAKRSHTQRWGAKLHEHRLNEQNGEIFDAIALEAKRNRAREFVAQLSRQEQRIIKEHIAERARAAEKKQRHLDNRFDQNGDIT